MKNSSQNYIKSIELLGEQIRQSFSETLAVKLPKSYGSVHNIITGGMGGSQLGIDLVKHLFSREIKLPIIQIRNYNLPNFTGSKSLILLLSYSGNTEEVLTLAKHSKNLKSISISAGGKLGELAKKNESVAYVYEPRNNPSGQPRLGTGYVIGSFLSILSKLKFADLPPNITEKMANGLEKANLKYKNTGLIGGFCKKLKGKMPILISSEFLQGNAHVMANQINESAKQSAFYYNLPELNHHLLESLSFPESNKNFHFVFFESALYNLKNQKRFKITQEVLSKRKISFSKIKFEGDKVEQSMEMLMFGSLASFELAMINKVDPSQVPWVDYFKTRLKN